MKRENLIETFRRMQDPNESLGVNSVVLADMIIREQEHLQSKVERLGGRLELSRDLKKYYEQRCSRWFLEVQHDFGDDTALRIHDRIREDMNEQAKAEGGKHD